MLVSLPQPVPDTADGHSSELLDLSVGPWEASGDGLCSVAPKTRSTRSSPVSCSRPWCWLLFLMSLAVLWVNRRRVGSAPWAFAALGAMFFLSIPMVLTRGGAEGAHRSWAFSFIGIAVLCGLAWSFGVPPAVRARSAPLGRCLRASGGGPVSGSAPWASCSLSCLSGAPRSGRTSPPVSPGARTVGDDARSVSREGAAVAAWMAAHAPVDTPVLADRYVSQQVGSGGRMAPLSPSATFPMWDLYMSAEPVRRARAEAGARRRGPLLRRRRADGDDTAADGLLVHQR